MWQSGTEEDPFHKTIVLFHSPPPHSPTLSAPMGKIKFCTQKFVHVQSALCNVSRNNDPSIELELFFPSVKVALIDKKHQDHDQIRFSYGKAGLSLHLTSSGRVKECVDKIGLISPTNGLNKSGKERKGNENCIDGDTVLTPSYDKRCCT